MNAPLNSASGQVCSDLNLSDPRTFSSDEEEKDLTKDFVKLFCLLIHSDPLSPPEPMIYDLLSFAYEFKFFIDSCTLFRVIQEKLPNFCFQRQIDDSALVGKVLRSIYHLQYEYKKKKSSIPKFFVKALNVPKKLKEDVLLERKSMGLTCLDYVTYFLQHAKAQRLTFGGRRLTEALSDVHPGQIYNPLLNSDGNTLLTLLQYGVSFVDKDNPNEVHPLFILGLSLIIFFITFSGRFNWNSLAPVHELTDSLKDSCAKYDLLLQSSPNPYVTTSKLCGAKSLNVLESLPDADVLIPFFDSIFPERGYGRPKPPSLQHLCRHVIRKRLYQNWQLPDGIHQLGLSRYLQNYMNFLVD